MVRKFIIAMFLVAIWCSSLPAQTLDVSLKPGGNIPLGPLSSNGEKLYTLGAGAILTAEYAFPKLSLLRAQGLVGYDLINTPAQTSLSLVTAGAGVGVQLAFAPFLVFEVSASGGYGLAIHQNIVGGAPYVSGDALISFRLNPSFSLGLGAGYRYYHALYNGISVFIGATFHTLQEKPKPRMEIRNIQLAPVFPVFYKYYDENPLGSIRIRNGETGKISDVKVSFFVKSYMDTAKESAAISSLDSNEEKEIPLFGLFNLSILSVTQGTKAPAEIQVRYKLRDIDMVLEQTKTLDIYNRNNMTWDDDRKAASFVTELDPGVLKYAKTIGGMARESGSQAVNLFFRQAMAVFESFPLYGLNYVVDPNSSYQDLSAQRTAVDFLQFPIQTLTYKAGDCDDLSILYSALLKSIGIEPAFITVPGHIFMAFDLGIQPAEAKRLFLNSDDLIFREERTWVPVEITMIRDGFVKAWQYGAREWRENGAAGKAAFYPISEAWKLYQPTGFIATDATVTLPDMTQVTRRYMTALDAFVGQELQSRVALLRADIKSNNNDPKLVNRLGVLYAQYGRLDSAEEELKKAAAAKYTPAIFNLGNIAFLQKDMRKAIGFFTQVLDKDPENLAAILGLARVNYEQENFGATKEYYAKLEARDPKLAEKYAYLALKSSDTGRAADVLARLNVSWEE